MSSPYKDTIILYHSNCPDGFASAFSAYKKFGDNATYLPVKHGQPAPEGLAGKEIYIIDFSYSKETLLSIEKEARSLVILDHHKSAEEAVRATKQHVFDLDHSGAGLAWRYFHPNATIPKLISYVEEGDLYRFSLPHVWEILKTIYATPFTFSDWDKVMKDLEDEKIFKEYVERGAHYVEYFQILSRVISEQRSLVQFEGTETYAVNAPRIFASELANQFAKEKAPLGIVWYVQDGIRHISLRGDGSIDVSELAQKYGGGGHKSASSFRLKESEPLPWTLIEEKE
jgi:oligoribonuclease NrnB/cAMP/cGMP phosphodiesterase (DHH superfamily)